MTVKILRDRGSDDHVYTGKWTLLDSTEQRIFNGPLHHPENSETPRSWSFSVPIPTKPRAYITQGHQRQASFVHFFNKDHPAYQILPGSFRTFCDDYASNSEAVVEYRFHARLYYERGGSKKNHYATIPIALRHASENIDTGQLQISKRTLSDPTTVRSRHLLPDVQKTKKFFGPSTAPEFWFKILMISSPVVQFNNPEPLPISLRITTLKGNDRTSKASKTSRNESRSIT